MDPLNDLTALFEDCRLCPRSCGVNRLQGERGICGEDARLRVARAALHHWEEPCLSGEASDGEPSHNPGSGAVFFSGCSLGCVYCQNRVISGNSCESPDPDDARGICVSPERLTQIFLELQAQGALNINLVTAAHFVPYLPAAITRARQQGLTVPIVYNSSSYEKPETLRLLEGFVDIYLPDYKYRSPEPAARYSNAPDYPDVALAAIDEMLRQVGEPVFDSVGILRKGVIIRQLLLPGQLEDAKHALRTLYRRYGDRVYFSLMSQYTPMPGVPEELARPVSRRAYDKLVALALSLGIENAFIQEGEAASESFIPAFNGEGVLPQP